MIFGKIDYLNLLPFHVFLKSAPLSSQIKKAIEFKKGVPSKLNRALNARKIDAAVISSIASKKANLKKLNFGIVAKNDVKSVLVRKNSAPKPDPASASSNALAKVLRLNGEVIIGDRALRAYLSEGKECFYDLGRFSYVKNGSFYKKLVAKFLQKNVKIPNYILAQYAKSRGISEQDIKWYLKFISYKIGPKEQKSLRKFFKEDRLLKAEKRIKF